MQKQYYNKIFFQLIACQFTSSTNAWILAFELDIARKKSMFEHMHRHSWLLGLPSIWLHWYFVCRVFRFLSLRIRNLTLDWDSFLVDSTSKDYVLHTWELKMASSFFRRAYNRKYILSGCRLVTEWWYRRILDNEFIIL